MDKFWRAALTVGGIGAIGAFVFYSLYKEWLTLGIFSKLTAEHTFFLMLAFLGLVFLVAIVMIVAWLIQQLKDASPKGNPGLEIGIDQGWSFNKAAEAIVSEGGFVLRTIGFEPEELNAALKSQTLRARDTAQALNNLRFITTEPIREYAVRLVDESIFELRVK